MDCPASIATLWRRRMTYSPLLETIQFGPDGLVLGAGTILSKFADDPGRVDRDRLATLLTVVGGAPVPPEGITHLEAAMGHWRRGDKALGYFRLSHARLPRVASPHDAYRLFLAETLLDAGFAAGALLKELGFDPVAPLLKYDGQSRVPAGNGRASGQFGSGEGVPSSALIAALPKATSLLEDIASEAIEALTRYASRFSVPTLILGALLIPTPNDGGVTKGALPGFPNVSFEADGAAGTLRLDAKDADGNDVSILARNNHGLFIDMETGQPIGRDLAGALYLDPDAVHARLPQTETKPAEEGPEDKPTFAPGEAKLCPAPVPDRAGGLFNFFALIYARHVRETIVNPEVQPPVPIELAYSLPNPNPGLRDSPIVVFDDCKESNGRMQEYKGHYAPMVLDEFKRDFFIEPDF